MTDVKEKIVVSQSIASDLVAEMSTVLDQKEYDEESLQNIYRRLKELSSTLDEITSGGMEF